MSLEYTFDKVQLFFYDLIRSDLSAKINIAIR